MLTNRTYYRGSLAHYDMAAVAALPYGTSVFCKDELVVYVLQELQITLLVLLLDGSYLAELGCNTEEALFFSLLGHTVVHVGPFVVLALGGSFRFSSVEGISAP